jgi:hypothetical protein
MPPSKLRQLSGFLFGLLLLPAFFSLTAAAQTSLGSVNIGSSTTSTVTVTIPGGGTLSTISVVTQGTPNLDFTDAGGGSCATGVVYAANATCTVNVAFKPRYAGARYGAVVLAASTSILATAYLQGQGLGPQATFLPGTKSTLTFGPNGSIEASEVVADGNGNLYVNSGWNQIFKETLSSSGYTESLIVDYSSQNTSAGNQNNTIAVDGAGNVYYYYADNYINNIAKASLNAGVYTTSTIYTSNQSLAGNPVQFTADESGDVFILDPISGDLLEEVLSNGTYSEFYINYTLPQYTHPVYVAVDGNGNIFISIYTFDGNEAILEVSPSPTSLIGYTYNFIGTNISYPGAWIAVDGMGNLYISAGYSNGLQMFKETYSNGSYIQSIIAEYGTTVDGAGNLYYSNGFVEKVDNADPPTLSFQPTFKGASSTDSPQIVTVSNYGNEPMNISAVSFPLDFPEAGAAVGDCASGTSLPVSESCTLSVDFSPIAALGTTPNDLNETVSVTTNTLNTTATQQNVAVAGLEGINQPVPAPVFSLPSGTYSSQILTVNASDAVQGATINYTLLLISSTGTITSSPYVYSDQSPITINFTGLNAVTVEATATAPGYLNSPVSTVTYTYMDFNVSVSPSSISSSSGTATVTITPSNSNGFPFPVTFSCTEMVQGYSCSFSPPTVTPGNSAASTTMTLKAGSSSSELHRQIIPLFHGSVLAATLCCFGWRKRRSLRVLLLLMVSIAGLSLLNGCGMVCPSCEKTPTLPVTYTLSIVATSGSDSHSAFFSYIVNEPE